MWWLLGLLAALAAANNGTTRRASVSEVYRFMNDDSRVVTYRSRDGRGFFRFRFSLVSGDIRIHILGFPSPSIGSCHVLHDNRGPFICWSSAIRSIAAAEAVAAMWAEATLVYQRTGRPF